MRRAQREDRSRNSEATGACLEECRTNRADIQERHFEAGAYFVCYDLFCFTIYMYLFIDFFSNLFTAVEIFGPHYSTCDDTFVVRSEVVGFRRFFSQ